jgi:hypothetical protein
MPRLAFVLLITFLSSGCAIFNSGTVHLKYSKVKVQFDDVNYQNKERWSDVSFSVRNIQHPSLFQGWATNISIDPSIHYDRQLFRSDETFINAQGVEQNYQDIMIRRLSAFANGKLVTHTGIGQFALSAGYGVGASRYEGHYSLKTIRMVEMRKIDLAYIGFVTDRVFFMMGPRYYREKRDEYILAIRIGYFWGEKEYRRGMIQLFGGQ